jgi:hypothetical protein
MTIQRDDWGDKFDTTGRELIPALPSIQDTHNAMVKGEAPSAEVTRAFADDSTTHAASTTSTPVPAKRGIDGIMRQDWDKPRNESGQFVSKTEGEMRQQWDKEGGIDQVAKVVMAKEATMYSVAPSLEAKVTEHLDKNFLMKAADHLRLGVSYGPNGFWDSVARFEDSLSPSERDAWARFCKSLNADEQAALIYGMTK